ncbi:MAG: hypothetical protein R2686_06950 [Candidatus Nanopelagicales bacterium]
MPWFKVDDALWAHPKIQSLSDRALALWVRTGSHCAYYLTDGIVRTDALRLFGATKRTCSELVVAGLWDEVPDGGYRFHDWHEYQHSAEWWKAKREADKRRQQKRRGSSGRNPGNGQFAKGIDQEPPDEDK